MGYMGHIALSKTFFCFSDPAMGNAGYTCIRRTFCWLNIILWVSYFTEHLCNILEIYLASETPLKKYLIFFMALGSISIKPETTLSF